MFFYYLLLKKKFLVLFFKVLATIIQILCCALFLFCVDFCVVSFVIRENQHGQRRVGGHNGDFCSPY